MTEEEARQLAKDFMAKSLSLEVEPIASPEENEELYVQGLLAESQAPKGQDRPLTRYMTHIAYGVGWGN